MELMVWLERLTSKCAREGKYGWLGSIRKGLPEEGTSYLSHIDLGRRKGVG